MEGYWDTHTTPPPPPPPPPFLLDRIPNGGGLLVYMKEDIPCKLMKKHTLPEDTKCLFTKINYARPNGCPVQFVIPHHKMS